MHHLTSLPGKAVSLVGGMVFKGLEVVVPAIERLLSRDSEDESASRGPSRPAPASEPAVAEEPSIVLHPELPLPTYERLSMPAILDALNGLTRDQLQTIKDYELRGEDRLPIIDRVDELLAVPIPS